MVKIKNKKIDYGDIFIILMFTVLIWSIYMWYYDIFKDYDPPQWGDRRDWGNNYPSYNCAYSLDRVLILPPVTLGGNETQTSQGYYEWIGGCSI